MSRVIPQKLKIAIATFVKTPGMSPIKTRLASGIGAQQALQFYIESVGHTYKLIESLKPQFQCEAYWAVAEKQAVGSIFWQKWPQVWQGEGELGDRLARVYSELKKSYDVVAFLGADSPHLPAERLSQGLRELVHGQADTVIGPTEDGGFYFLASRLIVEPHVWKNVTYSTTETLSQLKSHWPGRNIKSLAVDFDVDTTEDYNRWKNLNS
jgi:glycosyltransferase A (GT-A) superfamily protein (DUF2064 family)